MGVDKGGEAETENAKHFPAERLIHGSIRPGRQALQDCKALENRDSPPYSSLNLIQASRDQTIKQFPLSSAGTAAPTNG
jgi:hypothetical protein